MDARDELLLQCNNGVVRVGFTGTARRHRIGKAHALHVRFAVEPEPVPATEELDARAVRVGPDTTGRVLQIVALILEEEQELLVIHLMPAYRGSW